MLLRREQAGDVDRIDEIHRQAFAAGAADGAEPVEVALVRALRTDAGWVPALSLVAEVPDGDGVVGDGGDDGPDGGDGSPGGGGPVVGHVVATEGDVAGTVVVGLGPIGVLPAWQRRGVGHALMHAVVAAADALGYPAIVLLGHTDYYPRFGFVPAASLSIIPPNPTWGAHFQARPLSAYTPALRGPFTYAKPFAEL